MAQHKNPQIKNKKANYLFHLMEKYTAGIELKGTEIKSIRSGMASLSDSYCYFKKGELYAKMHIAEYTYGSINNHNPKRERKLLLKRREIKKLENSVKLRGNTIVPLLLYINENGLAKLQIALAKGKKVHDKREDIKRKDMKRDMEREKYR